MYTIVGETELLGTDVYSMVQAPSGDILLSTDRGLLRFDGYEFHQRSNAALQNASLFGLCRSPRDRIWCFNLAGQIFEYHSDSLHLSQQVPDSLVSGSMVILPLEEDALLISCKRLLRMEADGDWNLIDQDLSHSYGQNVVFNETGEFVYSPIVSPRVFVAGLSEAPREIPYRRHEQAFPMPTNVIAGGKGKHIWLREEATFRLFRLDGDSLTKVDMEVPEGISKEITHTMFVSAEGQVYLGMLSGGLLRFGKDGKLLDGGLVFPDYVISSFLEDREGNLWLGTLGGGLLLVHSSAQQIGLAPFGRNEKLRLLTAGGGERLFAASSNGRIYQIDSHGHSRVIAQEANSPIEHLNYFPEDNAISYGTVSQSVVVDLNTGQQARTTIPGTTKDHLKPLPGTSIFPSAGQLVLKPEGPEFPPSIGELAGFEKTDRGLAIIAGMGRCHAAWFDADRGALWVGTATGVKEVTPSGVRDLKWRGNSITASAMVFEGGSLWLTSSQHGILELRDGAVVREIGEKEGLLSREVRGLRVKRGKLYANLGKVIQVLDLETGKWKLFDETDGLSGTVIADFAVLDSVLCLTAGHDIRLISLYHSPTPSIPPLIRFTDFLVNAEAQSLTSFSDLSPSQNQVEFHFIGSSFRHLGQLRYAYRLVGAGEDWRETLPGQRSVRYSSLKPGEYRFEVKALVGEGLQSAPLQHAFSISPPLYLRWWFILLCSLALVGVVALIFLARIRGINRQNAIRNEKQLIERDLVDSRLTALRSQMNPHFIFNALNSIQEFILLNERRLAGKFLGKFAELMRTYLNHSRKKSVLLSDEISALKLYLELEQLRFGDSFTYFIEVDESLSPDILSIPSLLIQPYVENALKHGLLHLKDDRRLWLRFRKAGNVLVCEVEDNGVGRKAAAELHVARSPRHESYATEATYSRLELLNLGRDLDIGILIEDLEDGAGKASGTLVALRIPLEKGIVEK